MTEFDKLYSSVILRPELRGLPGEGDLQEGLLWKR